MDQETQEIQELKQQVAALKAKLDNYAEIDNRMIHKAMETSLGKLRILGAKKVRFAILATVLVLTILFLQKMPVVLILATAVMLGSDILIAILLKNKEDGIDLSSNLMETTRQLLEYKAFNRNTTLVGLPVALIWACWYVWQAGKSMNIIGTDNFPYLILSCVLGAIAGGLIGYFTMYRPSMKEADAILSQIDELS